MVKLTWERKVPVNINFVENKKKYSNFFEDFINNISFGNEQVLFNSEFTGWKNKLFWGDNLEVLYSLLNNFSNKVDLIYVDPPFFSGVNYKIEILEDDIVYDSIAYVDCWQNNLDSYLQMLYERIQLFKKLLSLRGLLFVHLDWHASHYIKILLDEVFGENRYVNNIIWYYYNKYSAGKKSLPRAYDNILVYSKSPDYTFNEIRIPRKKPRRQLKRVNVNGVLKNDKDESGHVKYRVVTDKKLDDVWKIPCLQPASKEWTGFPTQKHHALLERIIKLGSNEDDLIADFFSGSGTTLVEAERYNRRWIGCDCSKYSIYVICKRLLNYHRKHQKSYPFDLITHLDDEKKQIVDSGFFQKELIIKRKK